MSTRARVLVNGGVVTLDPSRPRASVLRVEAGRVTHVADDARGLDGERVDLAGAVVLPGLSDAHLHVAGIGRRTRELDLGRLPTLAAALAAIQQQHRARGADAWLLGRGWDQNLWPGGHYPTEEHLEQAAPGRAVALTRIDGHALWVSRRARELAGIGANTVDPPGGSIVRNERGAPTGILLDSAMGLVTARIPEAARAELRGDLVRGLLACAAVGLTSVHDMGVTPEMADLFAELERAGELPIRVFGHLYANLDELSERMSSPVRRARYQEVGVKLFADGALGSHGALLLCPYCDRADTSGLALMTPEELDHAADVVHRAGLQLAIHAIGDLANRRALDAIQRAQGSDHSRRHRVEHAQLLTAEDIPRFAELGVVASMQPSHATSDMGWVEARVGRERLAGAYAWRRLKTSGALLAFGSDAPIEHENPWFGLHAAVTREARPGGPEGGWFPEQRLNLSEALDAFVSGPARAVGQDEPRLAPGARADLSVVDRDPFSLAPADLWRVEPAATWVDGFEVFRR